MQRDGAMYVQDGRMNMTELEKLEAGLEYSYDDPEVEARKEMP